MIIYTPPKTDKFIPIIDLEGSFSSDIEQRKKVAWEIHKACRDTGFFYIKNHGVSHSLMQKHLEMAQAFFDLPMEEKMSISLSKSSCNRGYEKMAVQTLDEGSPPDLKEGFLMGVDPDASHPYLINNVPNMGPNQWPNSPSGFQAHFETYIEAMTLLGKQLIRSLALSLELPEDYFDDGLEDPMFGGRLLHYPTQPKNAEENQLGAGAHTDWGMITILLQDDIGGLEVRNADGDWISAPPIEGTFVINLGEMTKVLTNGLYQSNLHRVMNNKSGKSRYSAPIFFDPNYFYKIKCAPTCLPETGEPLLTEKTVGQHIADMYAKTYGSAAE